MSKKRLFEGFSDEKQKQYEREARLQYGPQQVNESIKRWNSYTPEQQQAIRDEGGQVYLDLAKAIEAGIPVQSSEVQAMIERWHSHIHYFYEPTLEILKGLAEGYKTHPDFIAFFQQIHADLPDYLFEAITQYVDDLETAEIARLIAEDDLHAADS